MSTEIRYVVDPRLRLEVANRISLDFLSEEDRKLMANIIRLGEFSIKTQPEKNLSEVKYKDSNKKSMKKKCFKTLELHEEMNQALMDCRDIFKPESTSRAFEKVVELTHMKIEFEGKKCVNSICTNFQTIPDRELAQIAAKVLKEMTTPEQVYEFFSLFVYRDNHKLMERFPNLFVHRETLYAFIKKFAPMKLKDLSENSDYAKMVAVLQEWLEDQIDVSKLDVLQEMLENYENLVNMGIQGLRVFNKRRQFFLNQYEHRVKVLKNEHNAKKEEFLKEIEFQEKRLKAKTLLLKDAAAEQKNGAKLIEQLETSLGKNQKQLQDAQNDKQIDQRKIQALEDEKETIISHFENQLRLSKERYDAIDYTLGETALKKNKMQEELKKVQSENESFKSKLAQLSITSEARQKLIAQLQMEKTELQSLREILEKEKNLLNTQVQTTQNNYNESILKIDELTARNQNLENEKTRLEREVSAASTINKSYEEKITDLGKEITSIDKKLKIAEEEKTLYKESQKQNAEMLISAQKKLEEEKKKLELSNQQNDDNLEIIKKQAEEYGAKLTKLEEEKKKLELSNQQNEDNLETIKKQVQIYDANITELKQEKQVLQNQKTETETKLKEAQKEIQTKKSEIYLYQQELKQTEEKNDDEKNKIAKFVQDLQSEIATLQEQKSEEITTLNSAIELLKAEKIDLEKEVEAKETELEEYKQQVRIRYGQFQNKHLKQKRNLKRELEEKTKEWTELKTRFEELDEMKIGLEAEKKQLTDAAEKLQEQNQDYKKNLEQANQIVRTLEAMTSAHERMIGRLDDDIVQLQQKISHSDSDDEEPDQDEEPHKTQLSKRHEPFLSMITDFFDMKTKQSDVRNGIQRANSPPPVNNVAEIYDKKQELLNRYFQNCKLIPEYKRELIENCRQNSNFEIWEQSIDLQISKWADDYIEHLLEFLCEAVEDENFGNAIVVVGPPTIQLVGYQFGKKGSTSFYLTNKIPITGISENFQNNDNSKEFTAEDALQPKQQQDQTPSSSFQPASFDVDSFTTPNATNIASSKMFAQPPNHSYYYPPVYHPPVSPWPLQFHMPQPQPTKHAGQVCYVVMPLSY